MTEHESEQFYRDLRQKLDGYGSAPPETVWEGIRQQVPARRKRRWEPILLLLFLSTALGWLALGPRLGGQGQATRPAGNATAAPGAGAATAGRNAPSPATGLHPAAPVTAAPATGAPEAAGEAAAPKAAAPEAAATSVTGDLAGPDWVGATRSLGPNGTATVLPLARRRPLSSASSASAEVTAASAARRTSRARLVGRLAGGRAATAAARPGARLGLAATSTRTGPRATWNPETTPTTPAPTTGWKRRRPTTSSTGFSNAPLAPRTVRPPVLAAAEPEVEAKRRPRARRPTRQELRLRGWSVQVLAGSALTYRTLNADSATQLEQLERPGVGYSVQVGGSYALTRQLTLSAGLGYREYATTLNYQLQKAGQETPTRINFRDVYRFVTIPLQAQYTLQGNHRWRYGVQGGGTVALLTAARTTEGSACNCSQRLWQPSSGGPSRFQGTNLQLSAGVFANYQFAPGQWLTLRPEGQLFLNSLTTPASGRAARRPWGLGLQAGYSWDLDPRKH